MLNKILLLFKRKELSSPNKIRIEACTLCHPENSRCIAQNKQHAMGEGYLKFDDFVKFTKLNPQIKAIVLSSTGEIFLNPELEAIMKYAYENSIALTTGSETNFVNVSDNMLDALVKYKFEYLTISICGWDKVSYSTYHRGGDFDKVIANIKKLNELKSKYNSQLPFLTWNFTVVESTDHLNGIKNAQKLAYDLGCRFEFIKDFNGYRSENIQTELGKHKLNFYEFPIPCSQLWLEPQINWDGRFMGCNVNNSYFFDNANLFEIPLSEYLKRPIIKNTKQMLMGQSCSGECNPYCQRMCYHYTVMKAKKHFMTENDLASRNVIRVNI